MRVAQKSGRWLIAQAPSLGVMVAGPTATRLPGQLHGCMGTCSRATSNALRARTFHQTANHRKGHSCDDSLPIRPCALYCEVVRRLCTCPSCSQAKPRWQLTGWPTWHTVSAASRLSVAIRQCHRPRERDENTDRRLVEPPSQWVDIHIDAAQPAVRLCALWLPAVVPYHVLCLPDCSLIQHVAIV